MVSVVIPARNAAGTLPGVLDALARQTVQHEVVVVDAASTDATAEVARAAGATVVRAERRNRSLARNSGVAAARGDLILFTDADCRPAPVWVEELGGCLEGGAELAAGPVQMTTGGAAVGVDASAAERFDLLWRYPQERYVRDAGVAASANLGIRRAAFEAIGGYDSAFHHGEDTDLCLRAADAGFTLVYCAAAEVSHPAATSFRGLVRRGFENGASATRLARRHGSRAGRRYWSSPGGLVRRGAALRALGVEPVRDSGVEVAARLDYAGRMAGSLWAELAPRALR